MRSAGGFPWARPRYELLLLALVAVVTLSPVAAPDPQDMSRICLAEAVLHGHLSNDECLSASFDRARYHGRLYSDKAPGLSLAEIPSVLVLNPGPQSATWPTFDLRVWGVRLLTIGVALLVGVFLVGRVSEGLAPGFGGAAMVTFALGTLEGPLSQVSFEQVPAAALGFGAFLLAWKRRPMLAGLLGGALILVDYESGLTVAAIAVYILLTRWRSLLPYAAGVVPGCALLAGYDWAAFGEPWHLSYRYVANIISADQASGFFGISIPHRFSTYQVFAGNDGLLVLSPVLVLAGYGLVRLGRSHRAEAILAGGVTVLFLIVNCGYFLPIGGASPGPRFVGAALPFLALGLAPAFAWRGRLTLALAAVSVVAMTAQGLVWGSGSWMRETVWGELVRVPIDLGSSRFVKALSPNILSELGPGRVWGAVLVAAAALGAFLFAASSMPRARRAEGAGRKRVSASRRATLATGVVALAVLGADASAVFAVPYGEMLSIPISPILTSIQASPEDSYIGGDVNFTVTVHSELNANLWDVLLTIKLSPGLQLEGPPHYIHGVGCTGTTTIVCNLDYLSAFLTTSVEFGVHIAAAQDDRAEVVAWASSKGTKGINTARSLISLTAGGLGCWQCNGSAPP